MNYVVCFVSVGSTLSVYAAVHVESEVCLKNVAGHDIVA